MCPGRVSGGAAGLDSVRLACRYTFPGLRQDGHVGMPAFSPPLPTPQRDSFWYGRARALVPMRAKPRISGVGLMLWLPRDRVSKSRFLVSQLGNVVGFLPVARRGPDGSVRASVAVVRERPLRLLVLCAHFAFLAAWSRGGWRCLGCIKG